MERRGLGSVTYATVAGGGDGGGGGGGGGRTRTRTMSHHTSNSLKAYCCDRTISPAGELADRSVSRASADHTAAITTATGGGAALLYRATRFRPPSAEGTRSAPLRRPPSGTVARYGGVGEKYPSLRPYHSVERPDGTASLGGGCASAPSPHPH